MNTHRIHRVAKLTGLSKDVVRVWERRYGLVKPLRSANRYREYTDEDVALLRFLKRELDHGQTIGALALEGRDSLLQRMRASSATATQELPPHEHLLDELISQLDPLDKSRFEQKLNGAVAVIPFEEAVTRILLPLQRRVGDLWHEGRFNVAIEHYVTKFIQQKLFSVMNQLAVNELGPRILVACPEGEWHEIGAQAVAYIAATRGCHVYYLGPNLPTPDLLAFCERIKPDLVLLSLTEIKSDAAARRLLQDLEPIATRWPVAVGGHGARVIEHLLHGGKIELLDDLTALHSRLMILVSNRMLASQG
ncbi:MAG TPA: cobalamin B12-binding domain-containing protein [Nitrospiraceae bacterium]|nr:cobalamin B12-binding domain-containing protein [Nitrospiraceae bacterium]